MSQAPAHQFEWWEHILNLHALKVGLAGVLALFFAEALRLQFPVVPVHRYGVDDRSVSWVHRT